MKKKLTALALVVVMVAMLFTGLTLAYFTDSDEAVNTFTVGNIDIELDEEVGVTGKDGTEYDDRVTQGDNYAIYENIMAGNTLEKKVTVSNTGNNSAYVRVTVILNNYDRINAMIEHFEDEGYDENKIQGIVDAVFDGWGIKYPHNNGYNASDMRMTIPGATDIDDDLLRVDSTFTTAAADGSYHFSRDNAFKSDNEKTWAATGYTGGYGTGFSGGYYAKILNDYELCYTYYLYMEPSDEATLFQGLTCPTYFDQEQAAMFNGLKIEIYADAIQAEGFADSEAGFKALEEAHPLKLIREQRYVAPGVPVATAAELQKALDNGEKYIALTADITGDVTVTQKPDVKSTIEGNGHTFSGVLLVDGKSATYTTAGLTIKNVNFKADSISADACIQLGNGTNATRYTCNVTVDGCTFDVPGAVGVKSYTGGDKNLTITGCTATEVCHSLVQAKGIDGILIENCKVYAKNGMNFNNSTNVTVSGTIADTKGYCVRFGESSGGSGAAETYRIENCSLKSACADGDAVIILRGTADNSTLTIVNTTITGTLEIANTATGATVINK